MSPSLRITVHYSLTAGKAFCLLLLVMLLLFSSSSSSSLVTSAPAQTDTVFSSESCCFLIHCSASCPPAVQSNVDRKCKLNNRCNEKNDSVKEEREKYVPVSHEVAFTWDTTVATLSVDCWICHWCCQRRHHRCCCVTGSLSSSLHATTLAGGSTVPLSGLQKHLSLLTIRVCAWERQSGEKKSPSRWMKRKRKTQRGREREQNERRSDFSSFIIHQLMLMNCHSSEGEASRFTWLGVSSCAFSFSLAAWKMHPNEHSLWRVRHFIASFFLLLHLCTHCILSSPLFSSHTHRSHACVCLCLFLSLSFSLCGKPSLSHRCFWFYAWPCHCCVLAHSASSSSSSSSSHSHHHQWMLSSLLLLLFPSLVISHASSHFVSSHFLSLHPACRLCKTLASSRKREK